MVDKNFRGSDLKRVEKVGEEHKIPKTEITSQKSCKNSKFEVTLLQILTLKPNN